MFYTYTRKTCRYGFSLYHSIKRNHFKNTPVVHSSAIVDLATEISTILPLWRQKLSAYFHLGEYYWKDFSSPEYPNIFSVLASPWTILKTEKRKFAFSWERKMSLDPLNSSPSAVTGDKSSDKSLGYTSASCISVYISYMYQQRCHLRRKGLRGQVWLSNCHTYYQWPWFGVQLLSNVYVPSRVQYQKCL